jgi:hypothetical protein
MRKEMQDTSDKIQGKEPAALGFFDIQIKQPCAQRTRPLVFFLFALVSHGIWRTRGAYSPAFCLR